MDTPDPEQAPIFVVGTGRSGTTLLRMMLCAHPRIYLTHEAYFYLWDAMQPKSLSGEAFLRRYVQCFSYRWLKLDPATWLPSVPRPLDRRNTGPMIAAIMRAKAAQQGKVRFGDKSPNHTANLGRIFEDFPGARVVRILRDPRAVTRSLQRMPWASSTIAGGAAVCGQEHKQCQPFLDRILTIRMEDLLSDPRATMGQVLEFVGEAWSEQVLDHATFGPGADDVPPVPWFGSATKAMRPFEPPDWSRLDPVDVRLMERLNRKAMAEGQYAPATLASEPSSLALLGRWLGEFPRVFYDLSLFIWMALSARRDADNADDPWHNGVFPKLNPKAWDLYPGLVMPDAPPLPEGWDRSL